MKIEFPWIKRSEANQRLHGTELAYQEQIKQIKLDIRNQIDRAIFEERKFFETKEFSSWEDRFDPERSDFCSADVIAEAINIGAAEALRALKEAYKMGDSTKIAYVEEAIKRGDYDDVRNWQEIAAGFDGDDPLRALTTAELQNIQDACWKKARKAPEGRSVVNMTRAYVLGRGIRFNCADSDIQLWLEEFWRRNKMERRQKKMFREWFVEGMYFAVYVVNSKDGTVTVRKFKSKEVTENIEIHPYDFETILSYGRKYNSGKMGASTTKIDWYPDINYYVQRDQKGGSTSVHEDGFATPEGGEVDTFVHYIKEDLVQGSTDEILGRPPMETSLPYFTHSETVCIDSVRRAHEQAKVVWLKNIGRSRGSESTDRTLKAPKGGVMLVETDQVSYRHESPQLAAGDMEKIQKMVHYMICAANGMPLHILMQDAENNNYASIKKADTPFSQSIIDYQDTWGEEFKTMFQFALRAAVKSGKLPEKVKVSRYVQEALLEAANLLLQMGVNSEGSFSVVEMKEAVGEVLGKDGSKEEVEYRTEDIPLEVIFPEVFREDQLELAKTMQVWSLLGVSLQTIHSRLGLDWREEFGKRKAMEETQHQEDLRREGDKVNAFMRGQSSELPDELPAE